MGLFDGKRIERLEQKVADLEAAAYLSRRTGAYNCFTGTTYDKHGAAFIIEKILAHLQLDLEKTKATPSRLVLASTAPAKVAKSAGHRQ